MELYITLVDFSNMAVSKKRDAHRTYFTVTIFVSKIASGGLPKEE